MKSTYTVKHQLHYLNEAILLLSSFSEDQEQYRILHSDSYHGLDKDTPETALIFELDDIRRDIRQRLKLPWERVAVYCSEFDKSKGNQLSLATMLFSPLYGDDLSPGQNFYDDSPREKVHQQIYQLILAAQELWEKEEPPEEYTKELVISLLLASELSDEKKLEYIAVVSDLEKALEECASFLIPTIQGIKTHEPRLQEIAAQYGTPIDLSTDMKQGFFKQRLQIPLNDEEMVVYPSVLTPNMGQVLALEDPVLGEAKSGTIIFYGILMDFLLRYKEEKESPEQRVTAILRILGDNTKQKILHALQYKPLYGQQIADMTELTTATVSYHMGLLLNEGLVSVEKQSVRAYYTLNSEALRQRLDEVIVYFGLKNKNPAPPAKEEGEHHVRTF